MRTSTLKRRNGGGVEESAIAAFRDGFAGQTIRPGDAAYDTARRIWNASIDRRPGLIARCTGTADVVRAVRFAREQNLLVAVRGGGHNVGGRAVCDDGIVIDLSGMKGVFVDPARRTVRVRAGALLGEVDRETHLHGLAVPLGTVSRTGVAGLTLGGGVGWLVRKHGLACDNLLGCEVVTATGEVLTADAESHPNLFWGLRGGGGNFGIVTSFLFRAHPVSTVLGGLILYPRDQARALLPYYRDFMATAPDELTAYCGLIAQPDGTPAALIGACYAGDPAEGERVLEPLRRFGRPFLDAIQPMPFPIMQTLADEAFPDGTYNYWKSAFVTALGDVVVDVLVEHGNRAGSPLSGVMVELYGGAAGRIAPEATAFAQRQAQFMIGISAQWTDPAESERHVGWARDLADALQPHASGGYLLNFLGEDPQAVRGAFGSNYARLARLKARYDPTNLFSLNPNVAPAREAEPSPAFS
ncbi:FAD-binding oxidoreductase [Marinivivus vitaminiproducens]|uniref:FAD-binding oxidoreductase n=1 Tax=Marinivivus vitaminiproducens TaxID=3035935 RepID=UPI0027A4527A|nr:FAD-binding oxidoreductase [Geminicoccaceae bacterium SCSIO 64248]